MRLFYGLPVLLFGVAMMCSCDQTPEKRLYTLFFGTYTRAESEGIYSAQFDVVEGTLLPLNEPVYSENPSFLAVAPDKQVLYAINEVNNYLGKGTGAVTAFRIDQETHALTELNHQSSHGAHPAHIVVDGTGRFVLTANYSGGNVAVIAIDSSGTLGSLEQMVVHTGSGPNLQRQKQPHPHSVTFSPDQRHVVVADLGIDQVKIYRWDAHEGTLTLNDPSAFNTAAGAGPRHFAFHPHMNYAYVINELASTITALNFNPDNGALTKVSTVSTLPEDWQGRNTCADIHLSKDGRFVYGSNRGHNSIAVFEIDRNTGELTRVQNQATRGSTPRNFALDPTGKWLLVANQNSDSITIFSIDNESGMLVPVGEPYTIPSPVCIRFLDLE